MASGAPERFAQAWGLESFVKRNQGPHRGGSLNGGPQEWMVYNGKSMKIPKMDDTVTGGTPMTQETSKYSR